MSNAVEYDFASVGESLLEVQQSLRADETMVQNYNLKTPLEFSGGTTGLFTVNTTPSTAIRDNLKNLLLTNWGERVCQYYFGANIRPLTSELGQPDFDAEAISRIRRTVAKYMPYITLTTFSVERQPELTTAGLAAVKIKVSYSVPRLQIISEAVSLVLYATG